MNNNNVELLESIVIEEDKILIGEAIKSFEAGALRSAYVMAWIAVAEGLKNKISQLAVRDNQAATKLVNIENQEKNGNVTDQLLIDKAKNLDILDLAESKKLQYIKDMRNEYASAFCDQRTH